MSNAMIFGYGVVVGIALSGMVMCIAFMFRNKSKD